MGYGNEETLHRRRLTSNQQIYKKKFNISSNKRNANQNYTMIPCHPNQNGNYEEYKQEQVLAKMWGNKVHSYIAGGAANQFSHSGKVWRFLRKLGMEPPFDPSIPLLGLH